MLTLLFALALAQDPESTPVTEETSAAEEEAPSSEEEAPTDGSTPAAGDDVPEGWTPLELERGEEDAPAADATPASAGDDNEIIVWGEGAIRHAREEIVRSMEELGYKVARRKTDGTVVFRPPQTWQGRVALNEGLLDFRRPAVALWLNEPERETQYDAARVMDGRDAPQGSGLRFVVLPSKRRLAHVKDRVLEGTEKDIRRYREVVQRTAREDQMYDLPTELDALWVDGTPLDGSGVALKSHADRRAHVLAYWSSRADTSAGDDVRTAVEAWLASVVQTSEHPLTADEIAAAEASAGRSLTLE